jgi:Arc/MetJ family transcription regulator
MAEATTRTTVTTTRTTVSCLGRTCLKWQADGELTALDLRLVLERLAQVDQDASVLLERSVAESPCPSIS